MTKWLKSNIATTLALTFSVGAVAVSSIKLDAVNTAEIQLRMTNIEEVVIPLTNKISHLEVQMGIVASTIGNHTVGLEDLALRTRSLETTTAVNNVVLVKLTEAVTELTQSTKQLTKTMTAVAVLDTKVEALTQSINRARID